MADTPQPVSPLVPSRDFGFRNLLQSNDAGEITGTTVNASQVRRDLRKAGEVAHVAVVRLGLFCIFYMKAKIEKAAKEGTKLSEKDVKTAMLADDGPLHTNDVQKEIDGQMIIEPGCTTPSGKPLSVGFLTTTIANTRRYVELTDEERAIADMQPNQKLFHAAIGIDNGAEPLSVEQLAVAATSKSESELTDSERVAKILAQCTSALRALDRIGRNEKKSDVALPDTLTEQQVRTLSVVLTGTMRKVLVDSEFIALAMNDIEDDEPETEKVTEQLSVA